jgi:hypothetical protein
VPGCSIVNMRSGRRVRAGDKVVDGSMLVWLQVGKDCRPELEPTHVSCTEALESPAALHGTHTSAIERAADGFDAFGASHIGEHLYAAVALRSFEQRTDFGVISNEHVVDARLERDRQTEQVVHAGTAQFRVVHGERGAAADLERCPCRRPWEEALEPAAADFGRGLAAPPGCGRIFAETRDKESCSNYVFKPLAHRPNSLARARARFPPEKVISRRWS